jgi:hypothetical protein
VSEGLAIGDRELSGLLGRARRSCRMSFAGLADELVGQGHAVSRQRLAEVERGAKQLEPVIWRGVVLALELLGADEAVLIELEDRVLSLVQPDPEFDDALPGQVRRRLSLLGRLPGTKDWSLLVAAMRELDVHIEAIHAETVRRLRRGTEGRSWVPSATDGMVIEHAGGLSIECARVTPFAAHTTLMNTGLQAWTDRLLVRLGPPVTSSLPFTLPVLAVPDTAPGESCTVVIPGRSHWFPNLARVSYVMTFPDLQRAHGDFLGILVDTRSADAPDQTFAVPGGLAGRAYRRIRRAISNRP